MPQNSWILSKTGTVIFLIFVGCIVFLFTELTSHGFNTVVHYVRRRQEEKLNFEQNVEEWRTIADALPIDELELLYNFLKTNNEPRTDRWFRTYRFNNPSINKMDIFYKKENSDRTTTYALTTNAFNFFKYVYNKYGSLNHFRNEV